MATSGGNFVSIAHLEIPLLIKMLMCQILIFPAVYVSWKKQHIWHFGTDTITFFLMNKYKVMDFSGMSAILISEDGVERGLNHQRVWIRQL